MSNKVAGNVKLLGLGSQIGEWSDIQIHDTITREQETYNTVEFIVLGVSYNTLDLLDGTIDFSRRTANQDLIDTERCCVGTKLSLAPHLDGKQLLFANNTKFRC